MLKIMMTVLVMIWASEVYSQQTLGGFGAGGMNGGGFGDPVANDYAGIDWRNDFISARMQGYSVEAANQYAQRMYRVRTARNRSYVKQYESKNGISRTEISKRSIRGSNPWMSQWYDLK